MNGTGDRGNYGAGGGGQGGNVQAPQQGVAGPGIDDSYLQNQLLGIAQRGGGFFGEGGLDRNADSLNRLRDGGVWWADNQAEGLPQLPQTPQPQAQLPQPQPQQQAAPFAAAAQSMQSASDAWKPFMAPTQQANTATGGIQAAPGGTLPQLPAYKQGVLNSLPNQPANWWKL